MEPVFLCSRLLVTMVRKGFRKGPDAELDVISVSFAGLLSCIGYSKTIFAVSRLALVFRVQCVRFVSRCDCAVGYHCGAMGRKVVSSPRLVTPEFS